MVFALSPKVFEVKKSIISHFKTLSMICLIFKIVEEQIALLVILELEVVYYYQLSLKFFLKTIVREMKPHSLTRFLFDSKMVEGQMAPLLQGATKTTIVWLDGRTCKNS